MAALRRKFFHNNKPQLKRAVLDRGAKGILWNSAREGLKVNLILTPNIPSNHTSMSNAHPHCLLITFELPTRTHIVPCVLHSGIRLISVLTVWLACQ